MIDAERFVLLFL